MGVTCRTISGPGAFARQAETPGIGFLYFGVDQTNNYCLVRAFVTFAQLQASCLPQFSVFMLS